MKKHERITGFIFILFGLATILYSTISLGLGNVKLPGPGFFPFICGSSLVVFSTIWLIATFKEKDTETKPFWEKGQWVKPLIAVIITSLYGAVMDGLGYILATFLFLVVWQIAIVHEKWLKTAIIGVVGTVVMYILFQFLLAVPLPEGLISIRF
jgi:hypothetical protein